MKRRGGRGKARWPRPSAVTLPSGKCSERKERQESLGGLRGPRPPHPRHTADGDRAPRTADGVTPTRGQHSRRLEAPQVSGSGSASRVTRESMWENWAPGTLIRPKSQRRNTGGESRSGSEARRPPHCTKNIRLHALTRPLNLGIAFFENKWLVVQDLPTPPQRRRAAPAGAGTCPHRAFRVGLGSSGIG